MFAFVLVFAGFANASPMYPAHEHKAKKGYLTIKARAEVGGVTLEPGDYRVQQVDSPSGPLLEFVHLFFNELASELVQANQEKVVARVKFTEQPLSSKPKSTQLILASNTADASGLRIRGDAFDYEFDQSALSAAPSATPNAMADAAQDATVNCANVGQQN
jgi:hypothetical protein